MPNHELDPAAQEAVATLRALLNAFDAASPDVQERMLAAAGGRTPDYRVPAELMETGYAISAMEENNPYLSHEEAVHQARTLRKVSEAIPATNGILRILAFQGRKLFRRRSAE